MKTISPDGIKLLHFFEKCVLTAYRNHPTEPWTIGWGNTYYENGKSIQKGDKINQERADSLFQTVLMRDFVPKVAKKVKAEINQNQFDAMVSLTYNIGVGAFEKSTLLRKVNANPADPSIRNEFMRWVSKGSVFELGLTKRRAREARLYFTPVLEKEI